MKGTRHNLEPHGLKVILLQNWRYNSYNRDFSDLRFLITESFLELFNFQRESGYDRVMLLNLLSSYRLSVEKAPGQAQAADHLRHSSFTVQLKQSFLADKKAQLSLHTAHYKPFNLNRASQAVFIFYPDLYWISYYCWCWPVHYSGFVKIKSHETGRENHCWHLTPRTYPVQVGTTFHCVPIQPDTRTVSSHMLSFRWIPETIQ